MKRPLPSLLLITVFACSCSSEPANPAKPNQAEPATAEPDEAEPDQAEPNQAEPDDQVEPPPTPDPAKPEISTGECDEQQTQISAQADERATPWSILAHLEANFSDMKVSWLMKEAPFQTYVVDTNATSFGRCTETGCYLFAAPTAVIEAAVEKSLTGEAHDAAVLGQALGLPAQNFEGPLRMMTLDLTAAAQTCVRLPVDDDPGVWKCESETDTDCFKFGGYTSGGVPELMVINAPVALATVRAIQ